MRKLICLLIILFAGTSFGKDAEAGLKATRELAGAVKTGDMMWMVERMYPMALRNAAKNLKGGQSELMAIYRKKGADLKKQGVTFEEFTVNDPVGTYYVRNKTELLLILPVRYVMAVKDPAGKTHKAEKKSFLYAIYIYDDRDGRDGGFIMDEAREKERAKEKGKWYFMDGNAYSLNEMRTFFYDLPQNIRLPKISERKLQ